MEALPNPILEDGGSALVGVGGTDLGADAFVVVEVVIFFADKS